MDTQFRAIELLSNLKSIKRTGPTQFAGTDSSQVSSIAEHSFQVAYLCLILGKLVPNVDSNNLLKMAVMHDWHEAIILDVPVSSKSYRSYFDADVKQIYSDAGSKAQNEILEDAQLEIPTLNEAEQKLFRFCDMLAHTLEMIELKGKGYNHKWIKKMFVVQIKLINEYDYEFKEELVNHLERSFEEGMDNYYLTKATSE